LFCGFSALPANFCTVGNSNGPGPLPFVFPFITGWTSRHSVLVGSEPLAVVNHKQTTDLHKQDGKGVV
jgi:hypothetical protein